MLCAKFSWNWPSGSGEEDENVKVYSTDGQTDKQTDDGELKTEVKIIKKKLNKNT